VVCRQRRDDAQLLRAGRDLDGRWYLGRGDGRGVWLCQGSKCVQELRASHVARSLRTAVSEGDVATVRALAVSGSSKWSQL